MPTQPLLDSAELELDLSCAACGFTCSAALLMPIEQRTVPNLQSFRTEDLRAATDEASCPHCAGALTLEGGRYRFDEPDLQPLEIDMDQGALTYDGQPVTDEDGLVALCGRALGVGAYQRHKLTVLSEPSAWQVSDGVITVAALIDVGRLDSDPEAAVGEPTRQALQASMKLLGDPDQDAMITTVGWTTGDDTLLAWLGPAADRLLNHEVVAQNIVRIDKLLSLIADPGLCGAPTGSPEVPAGPDGRELEASAEGVWFSLDDLHWGLSVEALVVMTVSHGLTLAEIAVWARSTVLRGLTCVRDALALLDPGLLRGAKIIPGPELVIDGRSVQLSTITRQAEWNAERAAEMMGRTLQSESGNVMPCGCEPVWALQVQPPGERDVQHMIHRPLGETGLVVCAALDCPHHTVRITEQYARDVHGVDEEGVWERCEQGVVGQAFDVQTRQIRDVSGTTHGCVVVGLHVAVALADARIARGMARAAGVPWRSDLVVVGARSSIVAVAGADAEPELVLRELAFVERALRHSPAGTGAATRAAVEWPAGGNAGGRFSAQPLELPSHPLSDLAG